MNLWAGNAGDAFHVLSHGTTTQRRHEVKSKEDAEVESHYLSYAQRDSLCLGFCYRFQGCHEVSKLINFGAYI